MQSSGDIERNGKLVYLVGRVLYIFALAASLESIWPVEHLLFAGKLTGSGQNTRLEFMVLFPWIMLAIAGLGLWLNAKRGKVDRAMAGGLLLMAALTVLLSYETLDKLLAKAIAISG